MTSQEGGNALGVKSHGVDRAVPLGPGIARLHRATLAVRPTEPYCVRPSLEPLWLAGSQFPGLAANVAQDSNEVSGRVSISPRGGRSSTWVTPGVAKLADGAPTVPQFFSRLSSFVYKRTCSTKQTKEQFQSSVGRLLNLGA